MIKRVFIRLFPFVFVVFFIYLESAPIYFYDNELVKPLMTFTIIYCWIQHDSDRFRPLWLLLFGLFYDFLKDGIVGVTSFFFLTMYHLSNNNIGIIATNYLNNILQKNINFSHLINNFPFFRENFHNNVDLLTKQTNIKKN